MQLAPSQRIGVMRWADSPASCSRSSATATCTTPTGCCAGPPPTCGWWAGRWAPTTCACDPTRRSAAWSTAGAASATCWARSPPGSWASAWRRTSPCSRTARALRPGGCRIVKTPNYDYNRLENRLNPFHVNPYVARRLRSELSAVFERVELSGLVFREEVDTVLEERPDPLSPERMPYRFG